MAVPMAVLNQHATAIDNLVLLGTRELVSLWRTLDVSDARRATDLLVAELPPLVEALGDVAATMGADYYDEARAWARAPGRHRAIPAASPSPRQLEAWVRWGVTPLWSDRPSPDRALRRLSGGMNRLVRQPERSTVADAAHTDPAGAGVARVPRAGACDFCLMLASRGAVYSTSTALLRSDGKRYHDNCACRSRTVFNPDDLPEINRTLAREWQRVTAGARSSAEMRDRWRAAVNDGDLDLAGLAS